MIQREERSQTPPSVPERRPKARRGKRLVIAPLIVLLIVWLWLFSAEGAYKGGPSGKAFGADFAMFVGGAQVLKTGGNPYNHILLYETETSLMRRQGLPMTHKKAVVRVGNPPLFFWLLQPLADLKFQLVAMAWILAMYALSFIGFIASLAYIGWQRWFIPGLLFLAMPQVVLGAFYGNVIGLVFAAIGCSLYLMRRSPLLSGALLSLAWLKPPVALPVVLLIVLFNAPVRGRLVAGFTAATALLLGLTIVTTGWHSVALWISGLTQYSHDMAIQPDVASLAGLYVRWAPAPLRLGLEGTIVVIACAATAALWWKYRSRAEAPIIALAALWFVWFLATPYAHFFDEMLLTVPVLALLGKDGSNLTRPPVAFAIYLLPISLVLIQGVFLSVPVLIAALCLVFAQPRFQEAFAR